MSYILNALRKSERERQAIEPDTVTNRIVVHQPPRQQNSTRLIITALVINLAFLGYFVGFTEKTPSVVKQSAIPVVKPVEVASAETIVKPRSVIKPPLPKTPAIAEIVDARAALPAGNPAMGIKQLPEPVKPVPSQPNISPAEPDEEIIAQQEQVATAAPSMPLSLSLAVPEPVQVKNDLPFLDELPAEFRRALPDLPINVFSYSSMPAERFVMIDMVKYVPGQHIKDILELKEIRGDSIVVSYNDRMFKIKRP